MRLASLLTAVALGVAACGPTQQATPPSVQQPATLPAIYQARVDTGPNGERIDIPAVRLAYLNERNSRQLVAYNGSERPGTIVVDPYARVLYHVQAGGQAMRYGVAVGRAGTGFEGTATIARKASWPAWRPTDNMIRTQPELYAQFRGGLTGGMHNPLGSRALYLYQGSRDTYYRIHGTMDPSSIGKATSAGCIRLFNQDVMDLFEQVPNGTTVVVRGPAESRRMEGPMIETPEGYVIPASEMAQATGQPVVAPAPQALAPTPVAQPANPYGVDAFATATPVVTDPFATAAFVSPVESAVPAR
ncbi:L,D-transpeptidase [Paracoccus sp. (in: a-proteobacteria)]|uniref:L,D-transpeptidase n=1 Tax=Paracoccus sp. TaxID=267 RepID=UPI0026DEB9B1|nr:L,D-transpeptidase family protein [Paracoccus sp. (in: a-proteobacteria)]MDO5647721.1 L,D-transpeptidase family protein [Paracoccus sp. (in: a-proteobacteria)]